MTVNSFGVIWFLFYIYIIPGEPDWIVDKRVSGYGDNLTLFCLIDDCCTKAGGWIKFDPDYKTIYLDVRISANNTSKDKYAATTNNTGFSLVIKNIQKEDINIKYSCLYGFEKSRQKVLRQSDAFREYPTKVNVLAIVLGVVIGIVLIGLALLLIWKLAITINDKRELARLENETKNAKWDTGEYPVYKPATSTYKNPAYAGK